MGGPMSANDVELHPRLSEEMDWMRRAVDADVPILGICLGSQLLARALGATVAPAEIKELGVAEIEVLDETDPLLSPLAPSTPVLHWHGEAFDLPPDARALACSAPTSIQAFRARRAWGLLFHAEGDTGLLRTWLDEPAMVDEAREVLGADAVDLLWSQRSHLRPSRGDKVFAAFASECISECEHDRPVHG